LARRTSKLDGNGPAQRLKRRRLSRQLCERRCDLRGLVDRHARSLVEPSGQPTTGPAVVGIELLRGYQGEEPQREVQPGGCYFEDCNEALVVHDSSGWIEGVAPWALDPSNAERLWDVSLDMLADALDAGETRKVRLVVNVDPADL
jgi:hypothetical protein